MAWVIFIIFVVLKPTMKVSLKLCAGPCSVPKVIWKNYQGKKYCRDCWSTIKPAEPPKKKQITIIPRTSEKRSKEERLYSAKRLIFLGEHPMCEAHIAGICTQTSKEVHHKEGRTGENYLDETKWLAACHSCHVWITDHPEEAIELGFSLKRTH